MSSMMSFLSMCLNCCSTCVPIHLRYMSTFIFKLVTHVPLHGRHMDGFLFKTQTKHSFFSLILSPFSLFSTFSLLLFSLSRSPSLSPSHPSLFLRPLSLTIFFRRRSLSPAPLFLRRRITINPKCFDLDFLRDSMGLSLCMSMN